MIVAVTSTCFKTGHRTSFRAVVHHGLQQFMVNFVLIAMNCTILRKRFGHAQWIRQIEEEGGGPHDQTVSQPWSVTCGASSTRAEVGHGQLATITENDSVFPFHQIVEEVVRVIVVRRIEMNQLVEVGKSCFALFLFPINVNGNRAPRTRRRGRSA